MDWNDWFDYQQARRDEYAPPVPAEYAPPSAQAVARATASQGPSPVTAADFHDFSHGAADTSTVPTDANNRPF